MYWGGGLLLTLLIISGVVSCLRSFSYTLNSVDDGASSGVTFAIYLNDGYDNYVEYEGDVFPAKADGYKYNADISNCTDLDGNSSSNYSLYYNNDMVQVSSSESIYCYIYFDMYSYDGDYCLVNGITEYLGECALVMDDYSYTVEAAKEAIEEKGEATTSAISPTITYGKSVSYNQTVNVSTQSNFTIGKGYSFSTTTGLYTLTTISTPSQIDDGYIGYYVCGEYSTLGCSTIYKIISYTITQGSSTTTQTITSADVYTYVTNSSIGSENGIYAAEDDVDTSYYYRGSVENNYVLFAGYYWRIVRINGDGSVRLIYQGETADATGDDAQIGKAAFNTTSSDPTYVGYMYGTTSSTPIIQSSTTNFTNFSANTTYYFGTGYEEAGDGKFKLSGTIINGTFSGLFGSGGTYENDITNYYTCFSTSSTGTCTLLKKINAYNSSTSANVYYISYASESYEDTLTNKYDSTIKEIVDKWYEENILGKYDEDGQGTHLFSQYISTSATFCGDRSLYSTFTGAGYILTATTYYSANGRLNSSGKPSLKCTNSEDLYSEDNGILKYPIALITADEVALSGGKIGNVNTLYYLYTGDSYWTMTPYDFNSSSGRGVVLYVQSEGNLHTNAITTNFGVRPVINLSSNVKISSGTGTASNPFVVTLD